MTHMRTFEMPAKALLFALSLAIVALLAFVPGRAFASETPFELGTASLFQNTTATAKALTGSAEDDLQGQHLPDRADLPDLAVACASAVYQNAEALGVVDSSKSNKVIAYDQAAIAAIGSQAQSGHTICCPSYSCAYADAVLDGTVRDHSYYTCSCCTWNDWGGGGSWNRNVGSDEQVLREAYDQIRAGRPVVTHVSWSGGEHWLALIGYENVTDPDHLTLANFIALDPWDGAQLNAGSKYALYGDGCQHVSTR